MPRLALLGLLLVLAACGGSGGGTGAGADDAAGLVPPSALAFVSVNTDFSSSQLKSAQDILDKFPIRDRLLAQLKQSARDSGLNLDALRSSAGPQVDIAVLTVNGETDAVGFAQPTDEDAFVQQLESGGEPTVHTKIDGWTVFSDKQAFVDAVKNRTGNLGDEQSYTGALATLPEEAIARAYISPAALNRAVSTFGVGSSLPLNAKGTRWIAAALTSASEAAKLEVHAKGLGENAKQRTAELAGQIPSGSIVALDLLGAGDALGANTKQTLQQFRGFLPFDPTAIVEALGSETIPYVRAGLPIPEVTVASKPKDVRASLRAVGDLVTQLAGPAQTSSVTVDGVVLTKADLGSFAIFYGAFDGELVVTDSQNAVSELRAKGDKLVDDGPFKDAKDGAGLPDDNQGFLFVNLKDAIPAAEGLAQLGNTRIPPEVDDNLKPLRSFLGYGSREGDVQSFVAYLATS